MKKSKILVPAIALLALGVAGSSVGTVAWFMSSTATSDVVAATGSVTATSGQTSADNFTLEAHVGSITNNNKVFLTNDEGKTKIWNGTSNIEITPTGGAAYATAPISFSVTYKGDAADAAAVLASWKDFVPSTGIDVNITDSTTYDDAHNFNQEMKDAEVSKKGLKFWNSVPGTSDWVLSAHKSIALNASQTLAENITFSKSGDVWIGSAEISCGNVLIGIQGLDSIVQDADDTYEFTATPKDIA